MLSETNTIIDVKEKLENEYAYFGYSSDEEFEGTLESVSEDVMRIYFYSRIGTIDYSVIQAKDKVDLTVTEEYLYWAEVFSICYEFLKFKGTTSGQLQTSGDESLTVEGYTYKTRDSGGAAPNDYSLKEYREKMISYFKFAGYDLMALERTCTIFGDSPSYEDIINIIE